jgi:cobalt-zinc-cadmium efflux system protein
MAKRPANESRTFGYYRVGVLAALANALTLVLLALYIFAEGYRRLVNPEPVASIPMMVVAVVAFGLNVAIALGLRSPGHKDVNIRSAFVHMMGDAVSSIGVLIAGIGILLTGSTLFDPAVSFLIGVFILWSSWGIIQDTVNILMEAAPKGIKLEDVARAIEQVSGVRSVHDLHAWSLASNVHALSAHVMLNNPATITQNEIIAIVDRVRQMLASRYEIAHSTIETHCADEPETDNLHCEINYKTPIEIPDHSHTTQNH